MPSTALQAEYWCSLQKVQIMLGITNDQAIQCAVALHKSLRVQIAA